MTASDGSTLNRYLAALAAEQEKIAAAANPASTAAIEERLRTCTPYQAAVVAALASHRSALAGELPAAETAFPEFGKLLAAATRMTRAHLLAAPAKRVTEEVSVRLEEVLGSEDFPAENEGGSEGYFMDIAVAIAYVRDAWTKNDVEYAVNALSHAYSFANRLGRHLETPPSEPLDTAETARQAADIDAVLALGESISVEQFDELAAAGDSLGEAYRGRLAEVVAAGL